MTFYQKIEGFEIPLEEKIELLITLMKFVLNVDEELPWTTHFGDLFLLQLMIFYKLWKFKDSGILGEKIELLITLIKFAFNMDEDSFHKWHTFLEILSYCNW